MSGNTNSKRILVGLALLGVFVESAVWATPTAGWIISLNPTAVNDSDYGGELVNISVSQPVVAGCAFANSYVLRDTNTIKGGLALVTAALIAGRTIDLYVSGDCDSSGQPLVNSVTMH